jgi:phosphomethylpyrimidine synthase
MCGPKFCSMKISHELQKTVREEGMKQKAKEFVENGSSLYQ